jgi:hypothetical protein
MYQLMDFIRQLLNMFLHREQRISARIGWANFLPIPSRLVVRSSRSKFLN